MRALRKVRGWSPDIKNEKIYMAESHHCPKSNTQLYTSAQPGCPKGLIWIIKLLIIS